MFFSRDTGIGVQGSSGWIDNHFDLDLSDQFGRAEDYQRHTLRMNGIYRLPWDVTLAGAYYFGSGNYFQSLTGLNPFGSNAGQRLRLDGSVIPVRDLKGTALSKLDVRVSKEIRLAGSVKVAGTAEVFTWSKAWPTTVNPYGISARCICRGAASWGSASPSNRSFSILAVFVAMRQIAGANTA